MRHVDQSGLDQMVLFYGYICFFILTQAFVAHDPFKKCPTFENLQIISVFTVSGYDKQCYFGFFTFFF